MNTQLLGGTLPDLVGGYADPGQKLSIAGHLDLFYDLSADLAKPNPYGSAPIWKDELVVAPRQFNDNVAIPEDKVFLLGNATPTAIASEVIYYNKDMFAKAGITATPKTWTELMATFKKLKDAGLTPMFVSGASQLWNMEWNVQLLEDQINDPVIRAINNAWGKDPNTTPNDEMMPWRSPTGSCAPTRRPRWISSACLRRCRSTGTATGRRRKRPTTSLRGALPPITGAAGISADITRIPSARSISALSLSLK